MEAPADLASNASFLYATLPTCIQVTCSSPQTWDGIPSPSSPVPLDMGREKTKSRQSGTQVCLPYPQLVGFSDTLGTPGE